MGQLIYSSIASLDGYVADAEGDFSWAAPDEEVHAYVNDLQRRIGTELYGRRMYEVMSVWESFGTRNDDSPAVRDFGEMWRAADKVVYSATLDSVATQRTRLVNAFDPEEVRELVRTAERDVSIGGPTLAAAALRAGLVDELQVFLVPHVVGGGTAYLPDDVRLRLTLQDERRFRGGVVFVRYGVESTSAS
jgi:dihydrofolate reductase